MQLATRIALAASLVFAFLHGRVLYGQSVLPFIVPENTFDAGNLSLDPDFQPIGVGVVVSWSNIPLVDSTNCGTVVGYTCDLTPPVLWQQVCVLPYQTNGEAWIVSSNPVTFYRVGNY